MTKHIKQSSRGRIEGAPNPIDAYVGKRIRLRRTLLGLSQEKFAAMLGITFQQVQKYERGMNRVGASRMWDICKILNVRVQYLFDEMPPEIAGQSPMMLNIPDVQAIELFDDDDECLPTDPMERAEAIQLVTAYYKIRNRKVAKSLLELAQNMSSFFSIYSTDEEI